MGFFAVALTLRIANYGGNDSQWDIILTVEMSFSRGKPEQRERFSDSNFFIVDFRFGRCFGNRSERHSIITVKFSYIFTI